MVLVHCTCPAATIFTHDYFGLLGPEIPSHARPDIGVESDFDFPVGDLLNIFQILVRMRARRATVAVSLK